jgi:hypothetical protein
MSIAADTVTTESLSNKSSDNLFENYKKDKLVIKLANQFKKELNETKGNIITDLVFRSKKGIKFDHIEIFKAKYSNLAQTKYTIHYGAHMAHHFYKYNEESDDERENPGTKYPYVGCGQGYDDEDDVTKDLKAVLATLLIRADNCFKCKECERYFQEDEYDDDTCLSCSLEKMKIKYADTSNLFDCVICAKQKHIANEQTNYCKNKHPTDNRLCMSCCKKIKNCPFCKEPLTLPEKPEYNE